MYKEILTDASAKIENRRALIAAKYTKQLENKKQPTKKIPKTLFNKCKPNNNNKLKFKS